MNLAAEPEETKGTAADDDVDVESSGFVATQELHPIPLYKHKSYTPCPKKRARVQSQSMGVNSMKKPFILGVSE